MKRTLITLALIAASFTAHANPLLESQALDAKIEIGKAVYNIASLTDSLTPKAKVNPMRAQFDLADGYAQLMDGFITKGLQAGADCETITAKGVQLSAQTFNVPAPSKPVAQNIDNFVAQSGVYILATCKNLSGE